MLDEHMGPIKKYSILTVGAVVLALANYVFKFPNHFSFGGVAGFAVILSGVLGGSASTYTFVIKTGTKVSDIITFYIRSDA